MVLVFLCLIFLFVGMYIGSKHDLKKVSISMIFGLFLINALFNIMIKGYYILFINYHYSTWFYLILGSIVGYLIMKIIDFKYDETDNISIAGFVLFNTILLVTGKFNILVLIINIFYYIMLGIYIRKSKSWISVLVGMVLGLFLGLVTSWMLGYVFAVIFGFVIYFIVSVYSIVLKTKDKLAYYGLLAGVIVALIGSVL